MFEVAEISEWTPAYIHLTRFPRQRRGRGELIILTLQVRRHCHAIIALWHYVTMYLVIFLGHQYSHFWVIDQRRVLFIHAD